MSTLTIPTPADMKAVLAGFCTGVAVVTACGGDGRPAGMAVQSFSSVSLDPPLVCFCPARTSATWPRIRAAGAFAVNVLAADQEELCRRFAVTGGDKFAGVNWRPGAGGAPLLDGALATVECVLEDVLDGGDHALALGRVTALAAHREGAPLLYFRRSYGRLADLSGDSSADLSDSSADFSGDAWAVRAASRASMSSSIAAARSRSEA